MTALRRRAADPLRPVLVIALALVAVGCGSTTPATPRTSTRPAASVAPASPQLTAVPGGNPSPGAGATATQPTTTETEFGTIFDALPESFPRLPGQEPAETGAGPTSGSFAVNLSAPDASAAMSAALSSAGWDVDVGSPLEDGTIVLDATHAPDGCRTEVRFTPLSGTVIMSVLYGASCPFG